MASDEQEPCKRPYELGKRRDNSSKTRERVLAAARSQLEASGVRDLTMDSLARAGGVTRQTLHNLFGTKSGVLESLFDQLAMDAGMQRMREVMQASDPESMLARFVEIFSSFWVKDRLLLKRIHGIAAVDPDFGRAVEARNQRRQMAATRVIDRLAAHGPARDSAERTQRIATLCALTSFEFFDALTESTGNSEAAAACLYPLVKKALAQELPR